MRRCRPCPNSVLPPTGFGGCAGFYAQCWPRRGFCQRAIGSPGLILYLVDTDVISEARKGAKGNVGVREFFANASQNNVALFLSAITIGELRQGVETIRHRGDMAQSARLERWLDRLTADFADAILPFDQDAAQIWGRLRVAHPENPLDKQIAATALIYDLTVVTRNTDHFAPTGVPMVNPFS
jgi:toxin FitB